MKRLSIVVLLLTAAIICIAQNSSNPFDIEKVNQHTIDSEITEVIDQLPIESANQNPFDVDTNRTTIKKKPVYVKPESGNQTSNPNNSFIFWISLLSLIITTVAITRDRKAFRNLPKLVTNRNYVKLVNRDLNSSRIVFYILLYVSYLFVGAAFVYLLASKYGITGFKSYSFILLALITVYLLRHIAMYLLRAMTSSIQAIADHNFLIMVGNAISGIVLLPCVLLINYSEALRGPVIIIAVFALFIIYLWRQATGGILALNDKHTTLFHFFIYICSFEIAPALIILKLIQGY